MKYNYQINSNLCVSIPAICKMIHVFIIRKKPFKNNLGCKFNILEIVHSWMPTV